MKGVGQFFAGLMFILVWLFIIGLLFQYCGTR